MRIRGALPGDAEALTALAFEAKRHWGYADEAMASWREALRVKPEQLAAGRAFVAELEGGIAGFSLLSGSASRPALEHLFVAPRCMRRGVGRVLLAHALEAASRMGASTVSVDADPNAESFYLAHGATRMGEVPAPIQGQPARVRPQLALKCSLARSA